MGLLKFAFLCIDLLAWPVIALGYPLFASIRAVETGSKHHMKKLVIYWTLFSLFSLFEFAFVRIIEWIPFWSSVRLVVIFWLVMPRFDGACHAYQGFVRPVLWGKVQAVINIFYKLKEERLSKRETYLDVIEKYIKENGSEAFEKLIALEHASQKCINFQRDAKILEPEGKKAVSTSKQLNELDAARRDTEMLEATVKSAATKTKQVQNAQSISSASVLNETDVVTNVKEMTPPEASGENRRPETPPLEKTHQEWTCDLCMVTATNETILNAHLQGRKHKSKLESLKASMLDAKDTAPSPLVQQQMQSVSTAWDLKGTYAAAEVKEIIPPKQTAENRRPVTPPPKKAQQEWTCDLCKETTTSEIMLNAHLHGSKHKSKLKTLKASELGAKDTGPSPSATSKLNHGNMAEELIKEIGSELEKLIASKLNEPDAARRDTEMLGATEKSAATKTKQVQNAQSISSASVLNETDVITNVKEMTPPEASGENRCPETPPLEKTHQEWTCDLCTVTFTNDNILNAHLQGRKHKSKLKSLKASMLDAKDTGSSPLRHAQSVSAAWDLKGTYAAAEVKEVMPPKQTAENRRPVTPPIKKVQQEWNCDLCKVTTTSEIKLNAHLHGSKHKSTIETLKASELGAKDTGPSPSATSKLNHGNVAEELIKEIGSELEKLIASEIACGLAATVEEMTPPEASRQDRGAETKTPPLKKEWRCGLCKVTTTSEKTLNAHLHGSKHKSKFESRKTSKIPAKDGEGTAKKSRKETKEKVQLQIFEEQWCDACNLKLLRAVDVASHLKGKRHKSNVEEMEKVEALIS